MRNELVVHNTMSLISIIVFGAVRVYAIWDSSVPMALLVLLLNLVPVAADIVRYFLFLTVYTESV